MAVRKNNYGRRRAGVATNKSDFLTRQQIKRQPPGAAFGNPKPSRPRFEQDNGR